MILTHPEQYMSTREAAVLWGTPRIPSAAGVKPAKFQVRNRLLPIVPGSSRAMPPAPVPKKANKNAPTRDLHPFVGTFFL